jgi:hypothetical protein
MKVIVVHDSLGRIVSVTKLSPDAAKESGIGVLPNPGESVVEVELTGGNANRSLSDIHSAMAVDVRSGKLIDRPAHWQSSQPISTG